MVFQTNKYSRNRYRNYLTEFRPDSLLEYTMVSKVLHLVYSILELSGTSLSVLRSVLTYLQTLALKSGAQTYVIVNHNPSLELNATKFFGACLL